MKIITNEKAYVQINDLAYLMKQLGEVSVPSSIIEKVFCKPFVCDNHNRYKFVEFDEEQEIEFFRKLDYSVDYFELRYLKDSVLVEMGNKVFLEMKSLKKKYDEMSEEEKKVSEDFIVAYERLEFKLHSIKDILLINQGKLKVKLPKDLREVKGVRKLFSKVKKR